jgi:dTDP-4-amino-4,6-dideoxygalactose transaminase
MIPLTDLKEQYRQIKSEIDNAVARVLSETSFVLGPDVKAFEKKLADYIGTKFAIGVASGTDALVLALAAAGIGKGDEVITTPFTFVATAEAIIRVGATPVFADIDPLTYNISPEQIEKKVTKKTRALLPVHLYGQACDMEKIMGIAEKRGLLVIEDCAQSIGSKFGAKMAGSFGAAGCFSFYPAKTLGCFGDGGLVTTNDPEIARKLEILRNHGSKTRYILETHGYNSRLDTIQAAILNVKLQYLDAWIEKRRQNAGVYFKLFKGFDKIKAPVEAPGSFHSFNYYTLMLKGGKGLRDKLAQHLSDKAISCGIFYPLALHLQKPYGYLGHKKGDFPVSEALQDQTISLPMYPELKVTDIEFITNTIKGFIENEK